MRKSHFKMYKSGKFWVVAGATLLTMSVIGNKEVLADGVVATSKSDVEQTQKTTVNSQSNQVTLVNSASSTSESAATSQNSVADVASVTSISDASDIPVSSVISSADNTTVESAASNSQVTTTAVEDVAKSEVPVTVKSMASASGADITKSVQEIVTVSSSAVTVASQTVNIDVSAGSSLSDSQLAELRTLASSGYQVAVTQKLAVSQPQPDESWKNLVDEVTLHAGEDYITYKPEGEGTVTDYSNGKNYHVTIKDTNVPENRIISEIKWPDNAEIEPVTGIFERYPYSEEAYYWVSDKAVIRVKDALIMLDGSKRDAYIQFTDYSGRLQEKRMLVSTTRLHQWRLKANYASKQIDITVYPIDISNETLNKSNELMSVDNYAYVTQPQGFAKGTNGLTKKFNAFNGEAQALSIGGAVVAAGDAAISKDGETGYTNVANAHYVFATLGRNFTAGLTNISGKSSYFTQYLGGEGHFTAINKTDYVNHGKEPVVVQPVKPIEQIKPVRPEMAGNQEKVVKTSAKKPQTVAGTINKETATKTISHNADKLQVEIVQQIKPAVKKVFKSTAPLKQTKWTLQPKAMNVTTKIEKKVLPVELPETGASNDCDTVGLSLALLTMSAGAGYVILKKR